MPSDLRERMLDQLLESYRLQYAEVCATWRELENKAQVTAGIAGVFLAAGLAFADRTDFEGWEVFVRVGGLLFFLGAVMLCLAAIRVGEFLYPPDGDELNDRVADMSKLDDQALLEALSHFHNYKKVLWGEAVAGIHSSNERKATRVLWAQRALVAAILCEVSLMVGQTI